MIKLMRKQFSNQRGVTLIELLAVIVILGILAAVAVPAVLNSIGDGKVKADNASIAVFDEAIERYQVINDNYPAGDDAGAVIASLTKAENGGPFLKNFPATPQQGGSWSYNKTTHTLTVE